MNRTPTSPNLWKDRYEALRRHFTENRAMLAADPLGLTLIFQNGMAGWIRGWKADQSDPLPTAKPSATPACGLPITPVCQRELTQLIAHMTAQHLHPVHRS